MEVALAVQALVQNQVDQLLLETRQCHWADWTHEDLRQASSLVRQERKKALLEQHPGLLSGLRAVDLGERAWTPIYVLSTTVPQARLKNTSHGSDLSLCDVVWAHDASRTKLSLTFFNNHLEKTSSFRHFVGGAPSTKRRSGWTAGRRAGGGFLRAVRSLMVALYGVCNSQQAAPGAGVTLRVGNDVGEFGWGAESQDGQTQLILKQMALTPLSLKDEVSRSDFAFPFDNDAPTSTRELPKEARIAAIYGHRFLLRMSEKTVAGARATEPSHERAIVKNDEVLVTVVELPISLHVEHLFSGVWAIFPPASQWIPRCRGRSVPELILYRPPKDHATAGIPTLTRPPFFYRGYHLPSGPSLGVLGIHYRGELDLSSDGQEVVTYGTLFDVYVAHLSIAIDSAIRTIPDLAVDLATYILTESTACSIKSGEATVHPSHIQVGPEDEDVAAYRKAFEAAWRRLDPSLTGYTGRVYPYSSDAQVEKVLIEHLGMRALSVQPHVKKLLERAGAYPPIRAYAQSLLLSAPGAQQPPKGTDTLTNALAILFPALKRNLLSVRNYEPARPRIVWNVETQVFVMSAYTTCAEHVPHDGDEVCLCWVGLVLSEAVADWNSKKPTEEQVSEAAMFHALLRCTATMPLAAESRYSSPRYTPLPSRAGESGENGDSELEYVERLSPAHTPTSTARTPSPLRGDKASFPYPSPTSPSLPHRRTRRRNSALVITPLVTRHTSPELASSRPMSGDDATSPKKPGAHKQPSYATTRNVTDITDVHMTLDSRLQAIKAYYSREVSAIREQLEHAQSELAKRDAVLTLHREESAVALLSKEGAIVARDLALETKDVMLRERDVKVEELRGRLDALTRRARGAEEHAQFADEKERKDFAKIHAAMAEMQQIQKGLLDTLGTTSEASVEGDLARNEDADGEDNNCIRDRAELAAQAVGTDEGPPAKRLRKC
ncbi:hypothetical protein C8Q79DRAFT_899762 [Trametes meyenii]|nr:hypothetical protein C8Q79DRAFT_899762 [Trametes meyenii]